MIKVNGVDISKFGSLEDFEVAIPEILSVDVYLGDIVTHLRENTHSIIWDFYTDWECYGFPEQLIIYHYTEALGYPLTSVTMTDALDSFFGTYSNDLDAGTAYINMYATNLEDPLYIFITGDGELCEQIAYRYLANDDDFYYYI